LGIIYKISKLKIKMTTKLDEEYNRWNISPEKGSHERKMKIVNDNVCMKEELRTFEMSN